MKPNEPIDIDPELDTEFSDEEFLDQDMPLDDDDGETYDENWEETDNLSAKPVAKKKKKSLFTILLIGGAVVIGGGILVLGLGGKKPTPAPTEQTAETTPASPEENTLLAMQQNGNAIPPAAVPADPSATPQAPKGFMNDPSQLPDAQATPSLPEQGPSMTGLGDPSPAPVPDAQTPENTALAQPSPATQDTAAPSAALSDLPVPQNLPNINQIKKATAPDIKADPAPATVSAEQASAEIKAPVISATETELKSKLDTAMDRIATLEKKLSEKPAAPVVTASNTEDDAKISELTATIEKLQDKVSALSAEKEASIPSYTQETPVKPAKKAVTKKKKLPAREPSYDESYTPATSYAPAYSPAKTGWELRGARPGEAMVAKAGQPGLQVVRVGDTIAGIGQVKSISQIGGAWVVQGTSGTIAQ